MTLMDADTESLTTHSAGQIEHQAQNNTSSRIRRRHLRLHWNEQVSQVIHREVRAAANVVENLGRRIGSVPLDGDLPRIVRHQRWSPLNVPLFWAAASDSPSCPVLEWIMAAASQITQPLQFHEGQINPREAAHVGKFCIATGLAIMENRIAGTLDRMVGTRRFSSHTPREPHQCPGTGGVVQSSVCGGREGGLVGVSVCGHGSSCWEAVQCSSWRFCSRTRTTKRCSRFRWVGTVGRSRPSRGIVDSRSHAEIMPPLAP